MKIAMFNCNSDEKFDIRSDEYQNYLIARDYNIFLVRSSIILLEVLTGGERESS